MGKNVYILGAGCSQEDGAPLIKDFIENIGFSYSSNLNDFILYVFNYPNIEEMLSFVDFQLNFGDSFQYNIYKFNLNEIRNEIIKIIFQRLDNKLMNSPTTENYRKFANKLGGDDTAISLNWDILLDKAFIRRPSFLTPLNYGVDFNFLDVDSTKSDKSKGIGNKLLKLHGSLNWLFCPNDKCTGLRKFYTTKGKDTVILEGKSVICPDCKNILEPFIIPPSFKQIGKEDYSKLTIPIWKEAEEELRLADKIIIIGYSFPHNDLYFKSLLRGAINTRDIYGVKKEIEIEVVNYKEYIQDQMEFQNHYKTIFDNLNIKVKPIFRLDKKFGEYVQ